MKDRSNKQRFGGTCARRTNGKSLGSFPNILKTMRPVRLCKNPRFKRKKKLQEENVKSIIISVARHLVQKGILHSQIKAWMCHKRNSKQNWILLINPPNPVRSKWQIATFTNHHTRNEFFGSKNFYNNQNNFIIDLKWQHHKKANSWGILDQASAKLKGFASFSTISDDQHHNYNNIDDHHHHHDVYFWLRECWLK